MEVVQDLCWQVLGLYCKITLRTKILDWRVLTCAQSFNVLYIFHKEVLKSPPFHSLNPHAIIFEGRTESHLEA